MITDYMRNNLDNEMLRYYEQDKINTRLSEIKYDKQALNADLTVRLSIDVELPLEIKKALQQRNYTHAKELIDEQSNNYKIILTLYKNIDILESEEEHYETRQNETC